MTSAPKNRRPEDDARLLLRFRSGELERYERERAQAGALAEALVGAPWGAVLPGGRREKAAPGDLRGIPVVGMGIGGVSPGTKPGSAASLRRLDEARERRRWAA